MSTSTARTLKHSPKVAPKATPFIKWVGGKAKLMAQLNPLMPDGVDRLRHVEPFIGGGAMFFARAPKRARISDINPELINVYRCVKSRVEDVIEELQHLAQGHSKEAYYRVRTRYNAERDAEDHVRAARFVYLNKTCFNGLHRVNRKGEFNVPAGSYKNPRIVNEDVLRRASATLRRTKIACGSFEDLIRDARPGDFVYFDPPYVPVSDTANFTNYAKNGFGLDEQTRLADVYRELDRRGCKLMLSNSDAKLVHTLYRDFNIDYVAAGRAINCNGRNRGKVREVVVRNYQ